MNAAQSEWKELAAIYEIRFGDFKKLLHAAQQQPDAA
jgi:hypothetical protein